METEKESEKELQRKIKYLELGMIQSCSASGECWDNAAMESVNGIIRKIKVKESTDSNRKCY